MTHPPGCFGKGAPADQIVITGFGYGDSRFVINYIASEQGGGVTPSGPGFTIRFDGDDPTIGRSTWLRFFP
jgi:hypothetical protein